MVQEASEDEQRVLKRADIHLADALCCMASGTAEDVPWADQADKHSRYEEDEREAHVVEVHGLDVRVCSEAEVEVRCHAKLAVVEVDAEGGYLARLASSLRPEEEVAVGEEAAAAADMTAPGVTAQGAATVLGALTETVLVLPAHLEH